MKANCSCIALQINKSMSGATFPSPQLSVRPLLAEGMPQDGRLLHTLPAIISSDASCEVIVAQPQPFAHNSGALSYQGTSALESSKPDDLFQLSEKQHRQCLRQQPALELLFTVYALYRQSAIQTTAVQQQ